jgi:sugar lactone lactonase YvrE
MRPEKHRFDRPASTFALRFGSVLAPGIALLAALAFGIPGGAADAQTAVGSTSGVMSATVTITAAGGLSSINVLTQGAANQDFKFVSGGTCTENNSYTVNQTCTVLYTFTPSRPGQRLGAVSLTSPPGSILHPLTQYSLGTAFISGIGTGPLAAFPGSTTIGPVNSGYNAAADAAVDGNGDVFVGDYGGGNVTEIVAVNGVVTSSSTVKVVGSGFTNPEGVAVDGAGNVFVADVGAAIVYEIVAVSGAVSSSSTVSTAANGFYAPEGVAVDGRGDVFVADNGAGADPAVYEIVAAANGTFTTVNNVGSGFTIPTSVAVDASGDVFVADYQSGDVYEVVAANGVVNSGSTVNTVAHGFVSPQGVAVDASGDLFVADTGGRKLYEIAPVGGAFTSGSPVYTLGSGYSGPNGVAVDGGGHVFVADNSVVDEVDLTQPPALAFASTLYGATSSDSPKNVIVQNEGNAALTFTSVATGTTSFPLSGTRTCLGSTVLSVSGYCTAAVNFTPQGLGALTDTLTLTDNSLNLAGSKQTAALSGTGAVGSKTINFTPPATPAAVGTSATLVATASNGDPVTFSVTAGTGNASISSGNVISYLTTGTVMVNANSGATSTYNAAPTVSYTVTINDTPLVFLAGSGKAASLDAGGVVASPAVSGGGVGAAVDSSGTVWSINSGGGGVTSITSAGALGTSYTSLGLSGATALAIDGYSHVVAANGNGSTVVFSNTGAIVSTTQGSTSAGGSGVAIDISGNIWVTNSAANSVDKIVGGAAPVAPLANAVLSATPGAKP